MGQTQTVWGKSTKSDGLQRVLVSLRSRFVFVASDALLKQKDRSPQTQIVMDASRVVSFSERRALESSQRYGPNLCSDSYCFLDQA